MGTGTLRGTIDGISRYDTLVVCLQMMENMRHVLSRGGRGVEWETGCEHTYKVFSKHEENVREMMRKIRGWETREEQEKRDGAGTNGAVVIPLGADGETLKLYTAEDRRSGEGTAGNG